MKTKNKGNKTIQNFIRKNNQYNIYILLVSAGILGRVLAYAYFGARFLVDPTFLFALILLIYLFNKKTSLSIASEKNKDLKYALNFFKNFIFIGITFILLFDLFVAVRDIHTIVSDTDERFVYSFDVVRDGRRYFTTKSEDVASVDRFPVYVMSKGEIIDTYYIDSNTGAYVDAEGKTITE